jgi:hypothetical protein
MNRHQKLAFADLLILLLFCVIMMLAGCAPYTDTSERLHNLECRIDKMQGLCPGTGLPFPPPPKQPERRKAERVVDTILWQFDWSRGVAVRIPIDELPWVGRVHLADPSGEWRIWTVDFLEGTPERPVASRSIYTGQVCGDTDPVWCRFGTHRDDVDTSKNYCIQARLHSTSRASAEEMARELRAGRGVSFVRERFKAPDPTNEEMRL